jgi:transposase-like protein
MRALSFKRHRFPTEVIRYAVWLYFRFTLSFRDVEELLAQRGVEVTYETIRCWTIKFGPQIARNLKRRPFASSAAKPCGSGMGLWPPEDLPLGFDFGGSS